MMKQLLWHPHPLLITISILSFVHVSTRPNFSHLVYENSRLVHKSRDSAVRGVSGAALARAYSGGRIQGSRHILCHAEASQSDHSDRRFVV